jgi:acetylglutamate kinase
MSGIDAGLVTVHRRPPQSVTDPSTGETRDVDFGFVGDVDAVNPKPIEHLLAGDYVPVVCSLAADSAGQIYNINADTLAASIAVELRAAKYIAVTTVDGVLDDLDDPHTLHSYLDIQEAESLMGSGRLGGGMLCLSALRGGVARAHVINGTSPDSLLNEIFTNEGCGTLIVAERERNRVNGSNGIAAVAAKASSV